MAGAPSRRPWTQLWLWWRSWHAGCKALYCGLPWKVQSRDVCGGLQDVATIHQVVDDVERVASASGHTLHLPKLCFGIPVGDCLKIHKRLVEAAFLQEIPWMPSADWFCSHRTRQGNVANSSAADRKKANPWKDTYIGAPWRLWNVQLSGLDATVISQRRSCCVRLWLNLSNSVLKREIFQGYSSYISVTSSGTSVLFESAVRDARSLSAAY